MEEENTFNPLLEAQLLSAVHESLQFNLFSNASFLAERLLAERDCEENRLLLAECYNSENKPHKSHYLLKDCTSPQARYKFALICLKLGKNVEAEKALTNNSVMIGKNNIAILNPETVPNGSYGLYVLGECMERQNKTNEARICFSLALEHNPTLWKAYEKLCKFGDKILPNSIFNQARFSRFETKRGNVARIPANKAADKGSAGSGMMKKDKEDVFVEGSQLDVFMKLSNSKLANELVSIEHPASDRVNMRKPNIKEDEKDKDLMNLLKVTGEAYYHMSQYYCSEAIEMFKKLPPKQYNTGWVNVNIARCYMEMIKHSKAVEYFKKAIEREPFRLEGMEYYSSCLWHLKKDYELCSLAYTCLEISKFAAETWMVVGNCFSLIKEHENALMYFLRATKINPQNAYAYSLCGHEYVYNENLPKAKKFFETALNLDGRFYNAWWGLGNIHYKQDKLDQAIQYFERALGLNPRCSILHTYLGMAKVAKQDYREALKQFEASEALDPDNILNGYQKANILNMLNQEKKAIEVLEALARKVPLESQIPLMLGKIYKKLGNKNEAYNYFQIAMDLEPKENLNIKNLLDSLGGKEQSDEMEY